MKRCNDSDSFQVSVGGLEYIFRLYFVDAPETSMEFSDRLQEQASYFGVTIDQVMQVRELAKRFTREKLSEPFIVRTCWEEAMGRSRFQRFYAFLQTCTGDLGEQLLENGLARTHLASGLPQGLNATTVHSQKLLALENKAKQEKIVWGVHAGRDWPPLSSFPTKSRVTAA